MERFIYGIYKPLNMDNERRSITILKTLSGIVLQTEIDSKEYYVLPLFTEPLPLLDAVRAQYYSVEIFRRAKYLEFNSQESFTSALGTAKSEYKQQLIDEQKCKQKRNEEAGDIFAPTYLTLIESEFGKSPETEQIECISEIVLEQLPQFYKSINEIKKEKAIPANTPRTVFDLTGYAYVPKNSQTITRHQHALQTLDAFMSLALAKYYGIFAETYAQLASMAQSPNR